MALIIGRKPVLEAINSGEELEQVYILHGQHGGIIDAIRIASKKKGIRCGEISSDKFRQITTNPNAQGVAARKTSQKYFTFQEIIHSSKEKKYPLILILDSIQDTHNLGAILRTAECTGVDGVLLTKHNSAPINETVVKTSTGATEHLKICLVDNLVNAIKELKENGFWIFGASLSNAKDYNTLDYKLPVAIILGNEEKGIRKLVAENCDFLVKIPMMGKIQSLNVSVSAGILLFEVLRQRSD
ncbi:MAG: 23S rRNA (guanosine(2251)-2'-O)-methyltransferase RlmB [Ignavibacteria bacterium RIFOXYB2_FULL_35_12]|nr:MAG: 23S rRNA (guanosine(2251)-2'-O)-methyltransferase RlmB [Ignavibacteria bacterium GWA2_36_19]OGU53734.1 MAG: 23S rRNA (guanosine(2251)-2'-O)-methyltransferase RlmB [Ignavibacteria bacterium GWC2_35_8]OGU59890.1 MAG: 23S rRNA (guanosine(2251)-2'-O)-methyltransferase RlmB [Ignavibacteria bacterium GWF2_35_20]OGU82179.1 MAG: 23S rRNA (guanosine(2251)-2'-O)-methyltransferase RlmB [Ignavibacteria bacterium RIFOXYA2_FULL_35_9]OGU89291.1 MAG: 23S rRNA (guanosine(2251)-2'-O)-methyltransferase Rl